MTPTTIIKDAAAEGVTLALTPAGTIKAAGDAGSIARWLPIIREHKVSLVTALAATANDVTAHQVGGDHDPVPIDIEARRQRVLAMLAAQPGIKYAMVTSMDDPAYPECVVLGVGIRQGDGTVYTADLIVPRERYYPLLMLELVERHGGTVH